MRESKRRKQQVRVQKIVFESDLPSGPHGFSRAILEREIRAIQAEALVKARRRWKRGLTDKDPVGVHRGTTNNEGPAPRRPMKNFDNEMVVIAEVCCSPREVRKLLTEKAERLLDQKTTEANAQWLVRKLHEYCDRHHYSGFQRKRTIEQVASRVLRRRQWANYRARYCD